MNLGEANGDAILLVGNVKDIHIRGNEMFDNSRQGVSIVGGKSIVIEENEIHHTQGTSPQFGIDIESRSYSSSDIEIRFNHFHHNRGGDIVNTDGRNVLIEDNILEQGEGNQYIDGPLVYWKNADLTIRANEITMLSVSVNNWNGIIMYSGDFEKTNPATTYIYNNIFHHCGVYMYKGADLNIHDNYMINGHVCFKEMTNLTLKDNKIETTSSDVWAYRFLQVSGSASGNKFNDVLYTIPLSSEPWDGDWIY
ncbi:right-handed parallel beta-helix repeat-containing protein [Labilibaculum antarcticum]|nr:right-handed parallel beta-helix repeat-containing protein [Labilibaculum antarcticum]